jgi:hypothetical protein
MRHISRGANELAGRGLSLPGPLALLTLAVPLLLALDTLTYQLALPVSIAIQPDAMTLMVGSQTVPLSRGTAPKVLFFPVQDPAIHEYQIDGSDSTNNYTLDVNYIHRISSSLYYRFQSWMRDLEGTSRWRNLQIWSGSRLVETVAWPEGGQTIALPSAGSLRISLELQRPETPRSLMLIGSDGSSLQITLDRNDRFISVTRTGSFASALPARETTFFPRDSAPFAAEVLDTLMRSMLWATLLILLVWGLEALAGATLLRLPGCQEHQVAREAARAAAWLREQWYQHARGLSALRSRLRDAVRAQLHWPLRLYRRLTAAVHPLALLALVGSCAYTLWIARVEYNGEPHIYDAAAYLFAAKMYAMGRLWVALPPTPDLFPGPFMVQFEGRWFAQYPPGTALTLTPGLWLGMPYAVEPLLGTGALLGIALIAARLYDRTTATLAIILGVLSPFYSYLAASYLSHTITLFYLVWGFWALLRFVQGEAAWNLPLAAFFFGMAYLTREEVALLYIAILTLGTLLLYRRRVRIAWRAWLPSAAVFGFTLLLFFILDLLFNSLLTGDPLTRPRQLFFAGDRWGFGPGIGFYGEHTVAAGLVNLDELLTILAIDLFGWPFYLTLALPLLPFLAGRPYPADWLLLAGTTCIALAFVGYFYHGIYLGPRYLYETLPFLLLLSARGLLTLARGAIALRRTVAAWRSGPAPKEGDTHGRQEAKGTMAPLSEEPRRRHFSPAVALLFAVLLACNLIYYTPRQIALYRNYSGLPAGTQIDLQAIYHPPIHHAIVVTDDTMIYQLVLFPLNDPLLQGDIIYARAADQQQYSRLRQAFPGRRLYLLAIAPDGQVSYLPLS